jgi:hypothetical protein
LITSSWGCAQEQHGNRLTSIEAPFVQEVLCVGIGEVSLLVSDSSGGEIQISRISICLGGQWAFIELLEYTVRYIEPDSPDSLIAPYLCLR